MNYPGEVSHAITHSRVTAHINILCKNPDCFYPESPYLTKTRKSLSSPDLFFFFTKEYLLACLRQGYFTWELSAASGHRLNSVWKLRWGPCFTFWRIIWQQHLPKSQCYWRLLWHRVSALPACSGPWLLQTLNVNIRIGSHWSALTLKVNMAVLSDSDPQPFWHWGPVW